MNRTLGCFDIVTGAIRLYYNLETDHIGNLISLSLFTLASQKNKGEAYFK